MFDFIKEISGILIPLFMFFCIIGCLHLSPDGNNAESNSNRNLNNSSGEETIKITCPSCGGKGYDEKVYGEYQNYPATSCMRCGGNGEPLNKQIKEKVYYKGSYQTGVRDVTNSSCILGRGFFYAIVPKGQTQLSKNQHQYISSKLFNGYKVPNQKTVCKELEKANYVLYSFTDTRGNKTYT